jgi:enoyl-CoA hydratase/carnithine racemase
VDPKLIICSKQEKTWTLTLNRMDKANVLNIAMLQELKAYFAAAAQEPALRALMLTGRENVFFALALILVDRSVRSTFKMFCGTKSVRH